jgi:hypothetical protein
MPLLRSPLPYALVQPAPALITGCTSSPHPPGGQRERVPSPAVNPRRSVLPDANRSRQECRSYEAICPMCLFSRPKCSDQRLHVPHPILPEARGAVVWTTYAGGRGVYPPFEPTCAAFFMASCGDKMLYSVACSGSDTDIFRLPLPRYCLTPGRERLDTVQH